MGGIEVTLLFAMTFLGKGVGMKGKTCEGFSNFDPFNLECS